MTDIVERLRTGKAAHNLDDIYDLCFEAASRIEADAATIKNLEEQVEDERAARLALERTNVWKLRADAADATIAELREQVAFVMNWHRAEAARLYAAAEDEEKSKLKPGELVGPTSYKLRIEAQRHLDHADAIERALAHPAPEEPARGAPKDGEGSK